MPYRSRQFIMHALTAALILTTALSLRAEHVVQIDVKPVLNTRSVTTLTKGTIVPWTMGVDDNGKFAGYMTTAAALFVGDKNPLALPDDGVFPAHGPLPEVVLNYANTDGTGNQTRYLIGLGEFSFAVAPHRYDKMFIFLTLGEGDYNLKSTPNLRVTLTYTDGTVSRDYLLMDYAANYPDTDPDFCNLISDRTKWRKDNSVAEAGHHNIHALDTHADAERVLKSIRVEKIRTEVRYPKHEGYLVFWGATGVAAHIHDPK